MNPAGPTSPPRVRRNYTVAGLVALSLLVADLVTKRWASMTFTAQPVDVIGSFLQFRYVENTGAAFSMFQNAGPLFGIAAIAAIAVVLWFLRKAPGMWEVVGLGFVLAGAAGNLVDRIARGPGILDGAVIDWVNLWIIPTFNLADASITVAVVLLLIGSWVTD
jgi:signal peptidase II